MICKIGWDFLSPKTDKALSSSDNKNLSPEASIDSKLFFPITFPITAGAGTIAVLIILSAQASRTSFSKWLIDTSSIILSVFGICILVFVCYVNANRLINYLGSHREKIVNSIMAFLIFCVGLQIAVDWITQLAK